MDIDELITLLLRHKFHTIQILPSTNGGPYEIRLFCNACKLTIFDDSWTI